MGTSFGSNRFSISTLAASKDTSNFRVLVRVRPPLKRELPTKGEKDDDGLKVKFSPITEVSDDGKILTLLEYLGQEQTEKGR